MKVSARNYLTLISKNDLLDIALRIFYWWKSGWVAEWSEVNNKQSRMFKHLFKEQGFLTLAYRWAS